MTVHLPQPTANTRGAFDAGDRMKIAETFTSIQGEGKLVGVPSFFIRVSGCNLRCHWCDTPYASWDPQGDSRSIENLVAEAGSSGIAHVVLTGGEPMIFPGTVDLTRALRDRGLHVTIETAGTVTQPGLACDLMSLSPKLRNSTPINDPRDPSQRWTERHERLRLNHAALQTLINDARSADADFQFKFVVTGPADLEEIDAILAPLIDWTPQDVLLMPEGVQTPSPEAVAWVLQACQQRNWRFAHRLHIDLFGNTRGT